MNDHILHVKKSFVITYMYVHMHLTCVCNAHVSPIFYLHCYFAHLTV